MELFPEFIPIKVKDENNLLNWQKYHCDICSKTLNGTHEWNKHNSSNRHKKQIRMKDRRIRRPPGHNNQEENANNNNNNINNNVTEQ